MAFADVVVLVIFLALLILACARIYSKRNTAGCGCGGGSSCVGCPMCEATASSPKV